MRKVEKNPMKTNNMNTNGNQWSPTIKLVKYTRENECTENRNQQIIITIVEHWTLVQTMEYNMNIYYKRAISIYTNMGFNAVCEWRQCNLVFFLHLHRHSKMVPDLNQPPSMCIWILKIDIYCVDFLRCSSIRYGAHNIILEISTIKIKRT